MIYFLSVVLCSLFSHSSFVLFSFFLRSSILLFLSSSISSLFFLVLLSLYCLQLVLCWLSLFISLLSHLCSIDSGTIVGNIFPVWDLQRRSSSLNIFSNNSFNLLSLTATNISIARFDSDSSNSSTSSTVLYCHLSFDSSNIITSSFSFNDSEVLTLPLLVA